jgi:glutamate carboxypeptidase
LDLARARAAELGIPLIAERSRGGSDASFAAALGVETLDGLGPICHDSCARGERIEIGSLVDRGALLAGLVLDVFSG